jgi:hypothetical protein
MRAPSANVAALVLVLASGARAAPKQPAAVAYDSPAAALRALLARERPRVVAFGEYHEIKGAPKVASALRHFQDELFAEVKPAASDLLVETWVTEGRCGSEEKQVVAKVEETTKRPEATESEIVGLLRHAKEAGLRPHILTLTCAEYASLQPEGAIDYQRLLSLVGDKLRQRIFQLLADKKTRTVLVYGGALHNDLYPEPLLAAYTFGAAVKKRSRDRYLEVDLYVPEYIEKDERLVAQPFWQAYQALGRTDRTVVVRRGAGSFIVIFPRGAAVP